MKLVELKKYKFSSDKKYSVDLVLGRVIDLKKQDLAGLVDKAIDLSNE